MLLFFFSLGGWQLLWFFSIGVQWSVSWLWLLVTSESPRVVWASCSDNTLHGVEELEPLVAISSLRLLDLSGNQEEELDRSEILMMWVGMEERPVQLKSLV